MAASAASAFASSDAPCGVAAAPTVVPEASTLFPLLTSWNQRLNSSSPKQLFQCFVVWIGWRQFLWCVGQFYIQL